LRLAATLRMPDGVLAQFDVGLDLPRRDELELIGTGGKLAIPDPWLCRPGYIELARAGHTERLDVDPAGMFRLTGRDLDAYRIEFETTSAAIQDRGQPSFGRADAVAQATVLEALRRSSLDAAPVSLDGR
jgi:xylose dehydrogenase (NAD/NADP)